MKKWVIAFILCVVGRWLYGNVESANLQYFIAYVTGVTVTIGVIKELFYMNIPRRIRVTVVEHEEDANKRP